MKNKLLRILSYVNPLDRSHGFMGQYFRNFLNPNFHEYGMDIRKYKWTGIGVLGTLIIVAIIAVLSTLLVVHYNQSYFDHHYKTPLFVPPPGKPVTAAGTIPTLAADGGINKTLLPGVGDQGPNGSCQGWAAVYYQMSYLYRKQHPGLWTRFSPRFAYDEASQGFDNGSWFNTDVAFLNSIGIPKFKQYPYGISTAIVGNQTYSINPYGVDWPLPGWTLSAAVANKYNFSVNTLFENSAAGPGGNLLIREQLAAGNPVNLGIPVFPGFDNATVTGGWIESPTPTDLQRLGPGGRGGHAITIIAYHDNWSHIDASGQQHKGYYEIINQWGKNWANHGIGYMPYDFVAQYGFSVKVLNLGQHLSSFLQFPHAGKLPPTNQQNPLKKFYKPTDYNKNAGAPGLIKPGAYAATNVHNVFLKNANGTYGADISALVNTIGHKYGVNPVFVAAVIGTESNFNQYAGRDTSYLDNSYGLMQVTIPTANQYGIYGDVVSWEYVPYNSIDLGTRILRDYIAYHGGRIQPPQAYGLYNSGPGFSDSYYYNLTGQAYQNYVYNFLPWWNYSLSHFAYFPAPVKPPVFNLMLWNGYRISHHESKISPYYGKSYSWAAGIWRYHQSSLGGIISSKWYGTYTKTTFAKGAVFTWPKYHKAKII